MGYSPSTLDKNKPDERTIITFPLFFPVGEVHTEMKPNQSKNTLNMIKSDKTKHRILAS